MKRKLIFLLIFVLLLSLAACGAEETPAPAFYYLRTEDAIRYGQPDALVAPVSQELSQDAPLSEMLELYFQGHVEETYYSLIPSGTQLLSVEQREDSLILVLSPEFSSLDGVQLSLAGACLAATCHSLTGCEALQVKSGENIYEFNLNDYVFLDSVAGK